MFGSPQSRHSRCRSAVYRFLDQDDMLHPQAFEALYYMVTRFNADVAAFRNKTVPDDFVMGETENYNLEELEYRFSTTPFEDFLPAAKRTRRFGSGLEPPV